MGMFRYLFDKQARPAVEAAAKSMREHPSDWTGSPGGTITHKCGTAIDPYCFLSMHNPRMFDLTRHEKKVLNDAIQQWAARRIENTHGNP